MSKILRNDTVSAIVINDTGITINPGVPNQYTIPSNDYLLWAASDNIITEVGAGNIVVNDGSTDLAISDGIDLIKGLFPKKMGVLAGDDLTQIGHVGDRIKVDSDISSSNLKDIMLEISAGNVTDVEHINKFGTVSNLSGIHFSAIWEGSSVYPWMTTNNTLTVESTNTNDNVTGTGARTVYLEGLDINYNPLNESVSLNGTTQVTTTGSFLRIYRARVTSAGSSGTAAGTIRIKDSGTLVAEIGVNSNQTSMAIYTVKAGYTAFLTNVSFSNPDSDDTDIHLEIRPFGEVFQLKLDVEVEKGAYYYSPKPYVKITEKSDIQVTAKSNLEEHELSASFDLILVKN